MLAKKKALLCYLISSISLIPLAAFSASKPFLTQLFSPPSNQATLAAQLGWVKSTENNCGGYYLEEPFTYPLTTNNQDTVEITSKQSFFSQQGTSILQGDVTATRQDQQITANKAYLYRDVITGKLNAMDVIGDVHLREPNTLIIGKQGYYNFVTKTKSLLDILYRTVLSNGRKILGSKISPADAQKERKITALTAWGHANQFSQSQIKVYELSQGSFSTCPPINPTWKLQASHIVLNKNTGRGYATHARLLVRNVPIFYIPYINFSIDRQRKSGFLWPSYGGSNQSGPSLFTPFYWNMAPNYDMTFTPGLLSKRGVQLSDNFRYLTAESEGNIYASVLPNDKAFSNFQKAAAVNQQYINPNSNNQPVPVTESELNRLLSDSTTRKSFLWRDDSHFNNNWSSHVDFNYAGDDYYLRNFGSNLNEITANQLLQEGDLYYKSQHWDFIGRIQAYQTLHPIDSPPVENQYQRLPQLILNGDYPDQTGGLEYFINSEITHFDMLNTPGAQISPPIGNRMHVQPGVNLPLYWPSFYINPRFQLALTDYNLYHPADTNTPTDKRRALPIFDVASGLSLSRDTSLFNQGYEQTLEPQLYYTYIPYRNQASIPTFDTTVNTLTYDQIFNYNRFTGLDRIGDANQLGGGVTTRLIDTHSGLEKVRLGAGEILYFANRRVTLCNDDSCTDNPQNHLNKQRFSPLSAVLDYHVNDQWKLASNAIWDPVTKQIDNTTVGLHYQPDDFHIVNIGFSYVLNGDIFSGITVNNSQNNLKLTDFSFAC